MAALSYLRYPTTRLAKISSALLALLLFAFVSLSTVAGFLLYQILHPSRTSANFDLSIMMGHPTTFSFPLPNGGTRDGWLYPGLRGAPTIIVCHGYQSQRAEVLTLVTALQDHEFNVFLFDFIGHGSSTGVTSLGYKESAELESALQALAGREDVDPRHFGLWGVDLGGYAALRVAAEDRRVAALVVDDGYADPRDMVQVQMKNSGLTVLPLVGNLADLGFRVLNFNYRNIPPVSQELANTAEVQKLFIQSDDRSDLSDMTLRLFVRAPDPKQTARDRASYSEMSDDDRKAYENRVVSFFLLSIPPTASRHGD